MKTSFSLDSIAFDMVSMENGRALYRGAIVTAGDYQCQDTLEISHLTSKNGVRRSMIKILRTWRNLSVSSSATNGSMSCSAHVVIAHDPLADNASTYVTEILRKICATLCGTEIALGDMDPGVALVNGTFIPDTYVDNGDEPT